MKDKIEKVRRCEMTQKYIAKELTHFTKTYEKLCDILKVSVMLDGPNIEDSRKGITEFIFMYKKNISQNAMIEVNKVFFSDIPEGQTDIHEQKYEHFGISFDKDFIIRKGGIPVHYVPREAAANSRGANEGETRASFFDRMTKELYGHFDSLIVENFHDEEKRKNIKDFTIFI
jgi:DNA polymerase elongation subunit (family B)